MIKHYINLTNGIEAIPVINENYSYIRIQSTICEQKLWDRLIQDLDYDLLMNLAIGNECIIYDFGANKPISRAVYQGLEFLKYVLNKRWLNKEYKTNVVKSKNTSRINCCNKYFEECYLKLEDRTKKKLDYFIPYVITDNIKLNSITRGTNHDNDKEYYRNILKSIA